MTTHHPRSITGPAMIGARFVLLEPGTAGRKHEPKPVSIQLLNVRESRQRYWGARASLAPLDRRNSRWLVRSLPSAARQIRMGQDVPMTISADDSGPVRIVTAVLRDGDRVLLCHRSAGRRWYPDVWDLPGGHVEGGGSEREPCPRASRGVGNHGIGAVQPADA